MILTIITALYKMSDFSLTLIPSIDARVRSGEFDLPSMLDQVLHKTCGVRASLSAHCH